ncbi:hypothetical protein CWI37_2882p0010 [Hamiltosporidium tvaerminnensis]|uniref:Uncharacterized protein n=1 Tax=Hamiltosporidium tvaerminnensis TaxID=1176355 RepID=A0A4Q9KPR7_9MICR|nr:hypothetical protein CWI37_2882p0010 [Hamiltosporidium tvaerminnensis]
MNLEIYIQYIVLKKTVEIIYFDRRRGLECYYESRDTWEPTSPLKHAIGEEDSAKNLKTKNITLLFQKNEESELKEEKTVVKKGRRKCTEIVKPF